MHLKILESNIGSPVLGTQQIASDYSQSLAIFTFTCVNFLPRNSTIYPNKPN